MFNEGASDITGTGRLHVIMTQSCRNDGCFDIVWEPCQCETIVKLQCFFIFIFYLQIDEWTWILMQIADFKPCLWTWGLGTWAQFHNDRDISKRIMRTCLYKADVFIFLFCLHTVLVVNLHSSWCMTLAQRLYAHLCYHKNNVLYKCQMTAPGLHSETFTDGNRDMICGCNSKSE